MSTLFSVRDKNVLVTGGSRGIGLMIARTLAAHGANILLTSRDEKACAKAAAYIQRTCSSRVAGSGDLPNCKYIASDVSNRQGCKDLADYTKHVFNGKLDVLVNNAGCSWGEEPSRESGRMNWGWDKVLDLNVKGLFYLTRECIPLLQRPLCDETSDANPGRVINIGSVAGIVSMESPTHAYDTSKAAVHHLTKKMAADMAKKGITINAIAPGFLETRMSQGLGKWAQNEDENDNQTSGLDHVKKNIPLGRMGREEDIAGAVMYLSSRAGAWCTGIILNVDGGVSGCLQIPLSSNL